jgi:hypothetical protein
MPKTKNVPNSVFLYFIKEEYAYKIKNTENNPTTMEGEMIALATMPVCGLVIKLLFVKTVENIKKIMTV